MVLSAARPCAPFPAHQRPRRTSRGPVTAGSAGSVVLGILGGVTWRSQPFPSAPPTPFSGCTAEGSRPWTSAVGRADGRPPPCPRGGFSTGSPAAGHADPHAPATHASAGSSPSKPVSGTRFIFTPASQTAKLGLRHAQGVSRSQTYFAQQTQGPADPRVRGPSSATQGGRRSVVEGGEPRPSTHEGR